MSATYPTTLAALERDFPECENLHLRGRDARQASLARIGFTDSTAADLLGTDVATVHALTQGVFDSIASPFTGDVVPLPEVLLPAKARHLRSAFARLLRAAEVLPARSVPAPMHETVSHFVANDGDGTADLEVVARLRQAMQGHTNRNRRSNPVARVQALRDWNAGAAEVAEVVGITPELARYWLTTADTVNDVSEARIRFEVLLAVAVAGPPLTATKREKNPVYF